MPASTNRSEIAVDVLVVGSGFAGSLTAAILQKYGVQTSLLDRTHHPRFAVGESSTPTSNLLLRDLAVKHGLDWLLPFCKYGPWIKHNPQVVCGIKRGFGYVAHEDGQSFVPLRDHSNELLVAASANDETSDTQWLRSDVDAHFFAQAQRAGVKCFEDAVVEQIEERGDWFVRGHTKNGELLIRAKFVIDATGSSELLVKQLNLGVPGGVDTPQLQTHSRSLFGHFAGLPRWQDILEVVSPTACVEHPFRCDDATLHHILDEGWMWWIRFNNDVTSVGFVLDSQRFPLTEETPEAEWSRLLAKYPSLNSAIARATRLNSIGLKRTPRLQRAFGQVVGSNWALMPHTAGFIDPLHSTGIAMSLAGVDRLTSALLCRRDDQQRGTLLRQYEQSLHSELRIVDLFVSGAYRAIKLKSFRKFVAFAMCYFAAATTWERRRISASTDSATALFLADDPQFRDAVASLHSRLETTSDADFEQECRRALLPFNHVGLFEPPIRNMYAATAVPETI